MNLNTFLDWLTDRGEGSWPQFKAAIETLGGSEPRRVWYNLASYGFTAITHAGARWTIQEPTAFVYDRLGDVPIAIVAGARTPALVAKLSEAATTYGCELLRQMRNGLPDKLSLQLDRDALLQLTGALSIRLIEDVTEYCCRTVRPIGRVIKEAPRQRSRPINWIAKSFDFDSMSWRGGAAPKSACEFTSHYGVKRYLFHASRGSYLEMSRSEAIYSSAVALSKKIASYDYTLRRLKVSMRAGLPLPYAFWATMSSCGPAPDFSENLIQFEMDVIPAQLLLAFLGQPL